MSTTQVAWDWDAVARDAGVDRDGRFNAGAARIDHPRALVWWRGPGRIEPWSGADLGRRAEVLAAGLRSAGVQPGDRVAGVLARTPDSLALPLAVWRLGAIFVPLFTGFGAEALAVRLEDSGTAVLVTDPANAADVARALPDGVRLVTVTEVAGCESLPKLAERAPARPGVAATAGSDPATIMYTSGTTGRPKGCVIPHRALFNLRPFIDACLALDARRDVLFSTADTGWSFGLYTTGLSPMSAGISRVMLEPGFDAATWWTAMRETGGTHLATAPTGLRQLAAAGTGGLGGPVPVAGATSAGEPLGPDVIGWFERHLGFRVHDAYGLTELGMVIANQRGPRAPEPRPGSMGTPLPGFEAALFDLDGGFLGQEGEARGRLAIRDNGNLLGMGYWGRQAEWDAKLADGWWCTEDLVERDADGRYWYVGRMDDVIVSAGYNVGPFDVESALVEHPAVLDAAAVGEPDERKGQVVAAHVVLADPGTDQAALLEALRTWVGERVGWHAAPRRLHVHDALPRTESGKVKRKDLRAG
ncbi:MAG TPA: AMP-binding protein [Solirubrobacteraceae bacterium]|jgi:acetyl-CoA synthetase